MSITQRINELGLKLPAVKAPAANYANAVRVGNLIYCSGAVPVTLDGEASKVVCLHVRVGEVGDREIWYSLTLRPPIAPAFSH